MKPTLVTLEGEEERIAELLGVDYDDAEYFSGRELSKDEMNYLSSKYPEYMGLFPAIPAFVSTAFSLGKKAVSAIKSASKKKAAKAAVKKENEAIADQKKQIENLKSQLMKSKTIQQQQPDQMTKMLPIAAIGLVLMVVLISRSEN